MSMINSMSRMRGQEKGPGYTQTEAVLAESMQRFGRELGEETNFGEQKQAKKKTQQKNLFFSSLGQPHIICMSLFCTNKVPVVCS